MGEISKNRSFFRNRVEDTNGGLMPESWVRETQLD